MARATGARARMALAFETTYGTAPASGFTRMPFVSSTLGAERPLLADDILGYGRDPLAPTPDVITAGGEVVVPIDLEFFGLWLTAAFGLPTTTGAGPYTHVFASGGWSLPSMAIELGYPEVPHYAMNVGAKVDRLSWMMQRSGLLTATATLISKSEAIDDASAAGTPAEPEFERFGQFHGQITLDGVAIGDLVSNEVTYANNLEPIETIAAGGTIADADPGKAALTGTLVARFSSAVLLEKAIAHEAVALEFGYTIDSGKSLIVMVPAVFLPRPKLETQGPQGIQATFAWQAAQSDGDPMCTVTLINSRESYA